ncbi:unnamed protein product [Prunus armeniaca]
MGVLSSFRELDESSVKLWNNLPEEKMGEDKGMGLEIAEVLGMRDEACSLDVVCLPFFELFCWVKGASLL